ncbi:PTS sugar transporter subunit IIC [Maledivibacter halophilus]|uniref:Permease IIC component n=1 Tax=Maledivibacter halophilus TaxID=36842 RepID=A0A1T5IEG2_9FIRM|nr:PTS sugar transporter subunit IIC [Maledivibacter halophilus]SKC37412.1 PTS system, cellobiose-specific IIC component [Maledivibacter halophilus]
MKSFISFLEKYFVPFAAKIGAQRHLVAIRDGFVAIMPLIIVGSLGTLVNNLGIPAYQSFMKNIFGPRWTLFGGNIWWGTFAIMSVFVAFTVAYNLAKSYDANPIAAGTISLCNYFMFIPQSINVAIGEKVGDIAVPAEFVGKEIEAWGNINWGFLNATSLFAALLIAIVSTEIFVRLSRSKKLTINMGENVPPAVAKSFASLLPVIIVVTIGSFASVFITLAGSNLFTFINGLIQKPLLNLGSSLLGAILIPFFNQLLWFFGLHGGNILEPVQQMLNTPAITANVEALAAGKAAPYVYCKPFYDAFVAMGGSGTTISLVAAIFVASKRKHYRTLAGLSAGPGLFNINESMIFGMPIVLNPIFFIPFLLVPVVVSVVAYIAIAIGLVPAVTVAIPWTTPPILGGYLATSGSFAGAILSTVNLALAFLIYVPFIILAEKFEDKVEEAK